MTTVPRKVTGWFATSLANYAQALDFKADKKRELDDARSGKASTPELQAMFGRTLYALDVRDLLRGHLLAASRRAEGSSWSRKNAAESPLMPPPTTTRS